MKGIIAVVLTVILCSQPLLAQRLFDSKETLEIKIKYSFKSIRRNTNDTIYFPAMVHFKNVNSTWDSIPATVRGRGNFRRKYCSLTPIRIKFKKKDAEGTLFEGNRNLKLVLQCQAVRGYDRYIWREYLCYQLNEPLTPYHFNTRLLNIELTDISTSKAKTYNIAGIFVEDDDNVAKRFNGNIVETRLHPLQLHDSSSVKHDFFQYLIGNTDWSSYANHNVNVMVMNKTKFVPLAYDFDMAGIVNAPYATINESLPITSVQQRLYRGYCRNETVYESVRQEYLFKETDLKNVLQANKKNFDEGEFRNIERFVEEFYDIFRDDKRFKSQILNGCRKE